jgi:hypothetical protein
MKENFEHHRDRDFASHSCSTYPKAKNPGPK